MPTNASQQEELYGNWRLHAPDGELLALIDMRRSNWYLKKNLAIQINEKTIRLLFEPKGRGNQIIYKDNLCVVCGATENLNKHHVIPQVYRKYMPNKIKSRSSHDVVSICVNCHSKYEEHATQYKMKIEQEYGLILNDPKMNHDLLDAQKAALALENHYDKIPVDRIEQLKQIVEEYLGKEYNSSLIPDLLNTPVTLKQNRNYEEILSNIDLKAFCRSWRVHFVEIMNPQYLPDNWSIEGPQDEEDD